MTGQAPHASRQKRRFLPEDNMQERLQKIISAAGLMSRRAAEQLIAAGKVTVNGIPAEPGMKADPEEDTILVSGKPVFQQEKKITVMLNKPAGVVTTLHDEQGRRSVSDFVRDVPGRVYPVGRLDMYSEGLLLMTNDGELANMLMHPSTEIRKMYRLTVRGDDLQRRIAMLSEPIEIDGRKTSPATVETLKISDGEAEISVTIHEGRNRQIRRLCERAGLKVVHLRRMREGPLSLGDLPRGKWRMLTEEEISSLKKAAGKSQ